MVETIVWLPSFIQPIADFLNIVILDKPFLFISIWSFVHLLVGGLIYYLIKKKDISNPYLATLSILFIWELFEVFMMYVTRMFIPEKLIDTISDVAIGMLGATFVWLFQEHR